MTAIAAPRASDGSGLLPTLLRSTPVRVAALALAAVVAYGSSLDAGVAWDDAATISGNPAIHRLDRPWRFFVDTWSSEPSSWMSHNHYRPLRTLVYAVQWAVFPGAAWGFHLTSLLLHGAGAAAVGWLTGLLFRRGAWLAAALWLLHPALSENVLYLAAQGNLLCVLLCVIAVAGHVAWLRSGRAAARIGSLAAAACAPWTYEFGALVPLLLLIVELYLWLDRQPLRSRLISRHLPYWCLLGSYLLVRAIVVQAVPYASWWGGGRIASLFMQLRIWVEGWRLSLLPTSQLPRYFGEDIPSWMTVEVAIAVNLVAGALAILSLRKRLPVWVAPTILWWYVAQVPTANLLRPNPGYPFAPRFLFLALVLLVCALGSWAAAAAGRRRTVVVAAAAVLIAFTALDRRQALVWRDGRTVFVRLLEHNPGDTLARYNFGALLYHGGELRAAARELEIVRRSNPDFGPAAFMLGEVLLRAGQPEKARFLYLEAVQKTRAHFGSRIRLARMSVDRGEPERAREWLEPLTYFPDPPPRLAAAIALGLAESSAALGHCRKAVEKAEEAVVRWPHSGDLLFEAGEVLASCDERERGRELRRRAAEAAGEEYRGMVGGFAW